MVAMLEMTGQLYVLPSRNTGRLSLLLADNPRTLADTAGRIGGVSIS